MKIHLAYGRKGLDLDLDSRWNVEVIEPEFVPGIEDPPRALREALRAPIGCAPLMAFAAAQDTVGIVINDVTRATPNESLLQALLQELRHVPRKNIRLFIALGTHRRNTQEELQELLGAYADAGFEIVQNDAFDPATQLRIGITGRGNEVWINRKLAQCSVRILTGFIEPHLFAGFSGGGKAVMPGMSGLKTIMGNHSAGNVAHSKATWGVTRGNPIWEEVQEAALMAGRNFLLNVALNKNQEITGVFAGHPHKAHELGVEFVRRTAMVPVEDPFDIVVSTNSGYPLDLNLYQTVKGMSAAAQIVRPGGTIVMASECWDGIPEHGRYRQLLRRAGSPQSLLAMIAADGFMEQDQWQAQVQAQVQLKADVYLYSDHLTPAQIREAWLKPSPSLEETLADRVGHYGPAARICVLPVGPQTIPILRDRR